MAVRWRPVTIRHPSPQRIELLTGAFFLAGTPTFIGAPYPPGRPDRQPLARSLRAHLRRTRLIPAGSRVVVAVSGGLDSVVLLHLLRFGRVVADIEVVAAHFDHAWRSDSMRDAMWVRGLCRAWEVPLEEGQSVQPRRTEANAREQRYEFLHNAAERLNATLIATAHHADDQAETVLFRMVRGTGITGLAAIPARRGAIVRPLLRYRRGRLVDYADAQGLRYRDDPTNRDLSFARNRIRHVILPALESVKPGAAAALARIADEAGDLEAALTWVLELLEKEVISTREDGALQLARPLLLSYHPWVRARVMRRVLHRLGQVPDRSGTQAALEFITTGASGGVIELAGGLRVEREFDRLIVQRSAPAAPADRPLTIPEPGTGRGAVMIGGRRFDVAWSNTSASDEPAEAFDPTTLRFPLELRSWRPGDRIRLAYGSKKLKKLFAERRVARGSRSRIPVLVDSGDRVVWVVGVARAMGMEPEPGGQGFRIRVANGEHG